MLTRALGVLITFVLCILILDTLHALTPLSLLAAVGLSYYLERTHAGI